MRVWSSDHWTLREFTLLFRPSLSSFPAQPSFLSVHASLLPSLSSLLAALEEPQGSWVLAPSLSSPKATPKPGMGRPGSVSSGPLLLLLELPKGRRLLALLGSRVRHIPPARALWTLPTSQPQCYLGPGVLSWRTGSP